MTAEQRVGAVVERRVKTDSFRRWGWIAATALVLAGCSTPSHKFAIEKDLFGFRNDPPAPPQPPTIRQPVLPEMLVNCRGHVLVPALGMTFLFKGQEPPPTGQYLREESLTPPFRIIRPNAAISREMSPARLNVELDSQSRIIGLYCG